MISRRQTRTLPIIGLPRVTFVNVEMSRCNACGAVGITVPRITELHRVLARAIINKKNRLTGDEVRFLCTWLNWSPQVFARRMGLTVEAVSRWEKAKTNIGPQADRLLRLLIAIEGRVEKYGAHTLLDEITDTAKPVRLRMYFGAKGWRYEVTD